MCSVPSILRNSRYRRDQRQLDEEEELWFNEEEEFDEGEAVVPAIAADLILPVSAKTQSSSNFALNPALTDSKSHQQQQQQQTMLNNNTSNNNITSQQPQMNNSTSTANESPIASDINPTPAVGTVEKTGTALFKKVHQKYTSLVTTILEFIDINFCNYCIFVLINTKTYNIERLKLKIRQINF